LEKININDKAKKDFLNYASAVIKSRAISNVQDNLKPVHRRILHVMADAKLWANKKTVKSSSIVGDTMKIHPHGDSSIYDAMVRLAQPWKMRYPLVDMQGNIGNIDGDPAAAMRYTEARLSKFGEMMLEDIKKDAVPFKLTYDESGLEPIVVPSKFPNILCNGNAGIAVGLSSSLVPHNLGEVVDGILAYLDFKSITIEKLMSYITGPDFPTGGMIIDANKLTEIYKTGNGTITLRSKYRIEEVKSQQHIILYEVPYLVSVEEGIIKPLKKLVIEDGFDLIDDYINESDDKGVSLRIILKKGANVYKVLDTLWKETRAQITQRINNMVLYDSNPRVLNLKELIQLYVEHRHNVITNIAKFDLNKIEEKLHATLGLATALDRIDEIVDLIKNSNNRSSAKIGIINLLNVTETQADTILDMKLSKLSKLDKIELQSEIVSLEQEKEKLNKVISNPSERENQMRRELINIKNLYKDERRTTMSFVGDSDGVRVDPVKVFMFENGNIFTTQQEIEVLTKAKKGTLLNQSPLKIYKETQTDSILRVFSKDGNMTLLKTLTLGIDAFESLGAAEAPIAAFDFDKEQGDWLVFVTKNGTIKKTSVGEYKDTRNNTKAIKLKEGDEVIAVMLATNEDYVYILGEKLVKFLVKDINPTTRLTIGTKGINGSAIGATVATEEDKILTMNDNGQGKLTKGSDFVTTAKGSNGQVITENTTLISAVKTPVIFVFADKKNHVIETTKLSVKSKSAVGAKIVSGIATSISV
jgi:DNA gyrase subunit A